MSKTWTRRDQKSKQEKENFKKWRRDRKQHKKGAKYVEQSSK